LGVVVVVVTVLVVVVVFEGLCSIRSWAKKPTTPNTNASITITASSRRPPIDMLE
jgi:hypothetical protein